MWQLSAPPSTNIEGFTTYISTNIGETVDFKINTDSADYRIDIYRLGYYGGDGATLVTTLQHQSSTAVDQPAPLVDPTTGLVDAGNWSVTDSWNIPADATSGLYVANLIREDGTAGESQVYFVVRNDASTSDIVFQTSDATWEAYNGWGGDSFYGPTGNQPAVSVSYNRPFAPQLETLPVSYPFNSPIDEEYPAIKWLEQNGYDVSYIAAVDTARNANLLLNHKVWMDAGHDEYWSADQRAAVTAARDGGVNLQFWSGNTMFWETRWSPSIDGSGTDYRTLTSYKQQFYLDPGPGWTGTFSDPNQPGGANPQNSLTGELFVANAYRSDTINVTSDYSALRFWANTSVAKLAAGESVSLTLGALGHEWDSNIDNGFQPAGLINLASTTVSITTGNLFDNATQTSGNGVATHNLTLYRAPSGALVFNAGDVFWSLNLGGPNPSQDAQQAMVNLFADMGVQPGSLQAVLQAAERSTDFTPPTSSLNAADPYTEGQQINLFGTATDFGGGVVAGVEVSTDGGAQWHPATGTSSWSYSWSPPAPGEYLAEIRAVDDSLNIEQPQIAGYLDIASTNGGSIAGHFDIADFMFGGTGDNYYQVNEANDVVVQPVSNSFASVWSYIPSYILPTNVQGLVLGNGAVDGTLVTAVNGTGNTLDNVIIGNAVSNTIDGGGGNDILTGGGGQDTFILDGQEAGGSQTITDFTAGIGGDIIAVRGSQLASFSDILSVSSNDGFGNTVITLDPNHSMTLQGINTTQLVATNFSFQSNDNTILGDAGDNVLTGGPGDDALIGGPGNDVMQGGLGNDTYEVTDLGDQVIELANQGLDSVWSYLPSYILPANVEGLVLGNGAVDGTLVTAVNGTGNTLDNVIIGNAVSNTIDGGGGNDILTGGEGQDTFILDGQEAGGSQTITDFTAGIGGDIIAVRGSQLASFSDILSVSSNDGFGNTVIILDPNHSMTLQGINTTQLVATNFSFQSNENIILGDAGDNVLTGGPGDDALIGGPGNDVMQGGLGNDTYEVTDLGDQVIELANQGLDSVWSYLPSYILPANVEGLVLGNGAVDGTLVTAVNGTGNTLDNVIIGNAVSNTIDGGGGNDILTGGEGQDTFILDGQEAGGSQTITDFTAGIGGDLIAVRGSQLASFSDILSVSSNDGLGNTVITLDPNHSMTLQGINTTQLVATNFSFGQIS